MSVSSSCVSKSIISECCDELLRAKTAVSSSPPLLVSDESGDVVAGIDGRRRVGLSIVMVTKLHDSRYPRNNKGIHLLSRHRLLTTFSAPTQMLN